MTKTLAPVGSSGSNFRESAAIRGRERTRTGPSTTVAIESRCRNVAETRGDCWPSPAEAGGVAAWTDAAAFVDAGYSGARSVPEAGGDAVAGVHPLTIATAVTHARRSSRVCI